MAEGGGDSGGDVFMGFEVESESAERALEKMDRLTKKVEQTLTEVKKASADANEEMEKGGEVAEQLESQFSGVKSAIVGAFSLEGVRQFFDYVEERRAKLAEGEQAERLSLAGALSSTGDVLDEGTRDRVSGELTRIKRGTSVPEADVFGLYARTRRGMAGPEGEKAALAITEEVVTQGEFMLPEQRDAIAQLMRARARAMGGVGDPDKAFDQAMQATFKGANVGDITGALGQVAASTTLGKGKEGELFDNMLALATSLGNANVDQRALRGTLDSLMEARTKTMKDAAGREMLVAPTLAGMMERDPVEALQAVIRGQVPQGEMEALFNPAERRALSEARRDFDKVLRAGPSGDVRAGGRAVMGDAAAIVDAERRVNVFQDINEEEDALRRVAVKRSIGAERYERMGGGVLGEVAKAGAGFEAWTREMNYGLNRMLGLSKEKPQPAAQDVRVTVRVEGPRDLDARVLQ